MPGAPRPVARPTGPVLAALAPELPAAVVHDGPGVVLACGAEEVVVASGQAAFAALDRLGDGWWAGAVSYELGRSVERVTRRVPAPDDLPDLSFVRFAALAHLDPDGGVRIEGRGDARRRLAAALDAPVAVPPPSTRGPWHSSLDRADFETGVHTIVGHIEAGDCYQVNLTRRLSAAPVDPVALWHAIESGNPAPHATFLRADDRAVVSASPERFLSLEERHVETRPIKGTAERAATLRASAKDRAENVMITDLARNDLGRVAVPGSVHVPALCELEPHPGLVHLVSTVRARLREEVGWGDLLRATFPPASVTGAPKPRVLQVIEDLEPVPRGLYCGALGFIDTHRDRADLAVAIRTFTLGPDSVHLGVGAGITADSDPAAEWAETELKAVRLLELAAPAPARVAVAAGAR
ncbi:MAG: anthranilate synthase component I family protein [Actinobacteria bacterium]|nr:anthranilate synthase component I family protein [Actinomycetota bacterium]